MFSRLFVVRFFGVLVLAVSANAAVGAPVSDSLAIAVGGIRQWITIHGDNPESPVLLFLHGGPGNSVMKYEKNFTSELRKHFVVAHWDQRESGETAALNASPVPLTVAQMEQDAVDVIRYLCKRFSKDKIYLMGHSWGGFLALRVADSHPELLRACIAVSPMVNQLESERLSLQWMVTKATAEKNKQALSELQSVRIPFENGDQLYYHRRWLAHYIGNKFPAKEFVTTWAAKWLPLFNEASAVNFFQTSPALKCPVYFFVGRLDYQTHHKLTAEYFHAVSADKKELFWFEKSAHSPNTKEPVKFQDIIIGNILLATRN